jgi:MHS family proline/betaine transporter-like MFS transporter
MTMLTDFDRPARAGLTRMVAAIVVGNGFIAYDFTIYSLSAVTIGTLFFPSRNPVSSLLLSLATFGAGFVMRPLGAAIIGHISDSRSRKTGMMLSLMLMTIATWMIACMPTYASIGPAATVLMVVARLMQGLAAGGEIGPASASLMEAVAHERRCFIVSWRGASQGMAAFTAALIAASTTALLSPATMQDWGWRIPFMIGGLIGPAGWYLRRRMPAIAEQSSKKLMFRPLFAEHARTLVYGVLMMAAPSASFYVAVFYLPSYLVQTLHWPATISLVTACLSGLIILVMTPLVAAIADRYASRKTVQYVMFSVSLMATYPAFRLLTQGVGHIGGLLIMAAYVTLSLNNAGAGSVLMLEAFPRHQRAAGLSVIYSLGVVIFGGFSPLLVTWLIHLTGDTMMPAWYLIGATATTLYALNRFPENRYARVATSGISAD